MIPGFVGTGPTFRSNSGSKRLCCLYVSVSTRFSALELSAYSGGLIFGHKDVELGNKLDRRQGHSQVLVIVGRRPWPRQSLPTNPCCSSCFNKLGRAVTEHSRGSGGECSGRVERRSHCTMGKLSDCKEAREEKAQCDRRKSVLVLVGGHAWVPRLWAIRASTSPCNVRDPFENKLSCGRPNSPYSSRAESSRVGQGRLLGYIAPI